MKGQFNFSFRKFPKAFKVIAVLCLVSFLLGVGLMGCAPEEPAEPAESEDPAEPVDEPEEEFSFEDFQFTFATHDPGTDFYNTTLAFTSVVERYSDMMITPQPVTSTLAFARHVTAGDAQAGINTATDQHDAFQSTGDFEGEDHTGLRLICAGNELIFGQFSDKASGIVEWEDMKGSEITLHLVGAGTSHVYEEAFLEVTGWEPGVDFTLLTAEHVAPAWEDLIEGRTEVIHNVVMPAFLEEASVRIDPWLIPTPDDIADAMIEIAPVFHKTETPREIATMPAGVPALGVRTFFFSHEDVPPEVIYHFLEIATDHYDEVYSASPEHTEFWEPEGFAEPGPVPFHEGAVEFFQDRGLWGDEQEENQQELLDMIPEIQDRIN